MELSERHRRYWRRNLQLSAALLLVWAGVTFGVGYFARSLNAEFFGWPFYFWVGAQGALLVYLLIIWFYARTMDRLDREFGVSEDEAP
ncbi:MAG TPA: DUF4212 domain-containing protein [Burkholderiaceae bacterium]